MHEETRETLRAVPAAVCIVAGFSLYTMGLLSYLTPTEGCAAGSDLFIYAGLPIVLLAVSAVIQPYRVLRLPIYLCAFAAALLAGIVQLGRGCLL